MRTSITYLYPLILFFTHSLSYAQCPDYLFDNASETYGVNPNLIKAIAMHESKCNQDAIGDARGEIGTMQILPATARSFGWDLKRLKSDVRYNIECGTAYLTILIQRLKETWGPESVDEKIDYIIGGYNTGESIFYKPQRFQITREYRRHVKDLFASFGNGPVEMKPVFASIEPWISSWVITALEHRQNHPLTINLSLKNIGTDTAESAKVIFTFRKSEWDIPRDSQPANVSIQDKEFEWLVSSSHGEVSPDDTVTTNVVAIPLHTRPSIKVRAVLERAGRKVSYPHKTEPEFLDAEGFPAIRKDLTIRPGSDWHETRQ